MSRTARGYRLRPGRRTNGDTLTIEDVTAPQVVGLDDRSAVDPSVSGAKAAALARARRAGLPTLPGFVLAASLAEAASRAEAARPAWEALSAGGTRPLVVRSSSPVEDTARSSMAGRFTSVVGVRGWDEFVAAVARVAGSYRRAALEDDRLPPDLPMPVLVQPLVDARAGGVAFGVDPVTGRSDRRVVAAVAGLPGDLVAGDVPGSRYELDAGGRRRAHEHAPGGARLSRRTLRRVARLADAAADVFGAPQDVEWAVDAAGRVLLLQSRPVTTEIRGVPRGPVLGPGPVVETFPDPLSRLEQDLWAEPLRRGMAAVFDVLGVVSRRRRQRSPLVAVVDGRVALDLELVEASHRAPWWAVARRLRSLRAAWRVGRLRAALPRLTADVVARTDELLLGVPPASELTDRQLVATLERCQDTLVTVHGYEMMVGLVLHPDGVELTASSVGLRILQRAREEGCPEDEIPLRHPVVLGLVPPRVGPRAVLPGRIAVPDRVPGAGDEPAVLREALRLRTRWLQELGARFAWELGVRLTARGVLAAPTRVRHLDLASLELTVRGLLVPVSVWEPVAGDEPASPPLPTRFRLSDTGRPIPWVPRVPVGAIGAGGGRGEGIVHHGADGAPDGAVVVVPTLDGRLAPQLPRFGALVAETGSVLAHLAILAREAGVPTVVGLAGAAERFAEGTRVRVDGATGEVTVLADGTGERA